MLVIDPVNEKDKLAKLHDRLVSDYGGSIQGYRDFLADWEKAVQADLADPQRSIRRHHQAHRGSSLGGEDEAVVPGLDADVVRTVKASPRWLTDMSEEVDRERSKKYPDWKAATNTVAEYLQRLSQERRRDRPAIREEQRQQRRRRAGSQVHQPTAFRSISRSRKMPTI